MQFEIVDRRAEKAAAEAAAPTALEIVEDRMNRANEALANGDLAAANAVSAECKNPPATYGDVVPFKKTVRGEVQTFRSVGYMLVQLNINGHGMFAGRAVGLRTDDGMFTADWMLPPVWDENLSWQAEALKRLNTFKSCSCGSRGPCGFHSEVCAGRLGAGRWIEEDMQRLKKVETTPLCEALEVLMRAEAARQNQRIVTPGR